jgi:hypothetical protein
MWKRACWSRGTWKALSAAQTTWPQRRQWWRRRMYQWKGCSQMLQPVAETSGFQCAVVGGPVTVVEAKGASSDWELE